ncbi:MAG: hypothetical protein CL558_11045 [Alphaproteobacteria bacterium]|nr:hypothetical protein [Alphaproteobacteria bacterium]MAS46053.1 hypothetical protein [Alphaproteobacteria bacterium]MAX95765.1 hypothetical protein [Alphaproteobacteria bacterium]MBN54101.1 hypothetical protein [Alphaproteobacteria bacterium]OUT42313.1 MAG: hypothetical protein CBB62_08540 [Micavibrio sp. TMED2]|tara:strand:- start:4311 stop:6515 length:2205 start_codon:yes stop_codon:yes gene_type:complete
MPLDEPFDQQLRQSRAGRLARSIRRGLLIRREQWLHDWFLPRPDQWASRWYVWTPAGLMTGVCVYFALLFEPPVWSGPLLAFLLLVTLLAVSDRVWARQGINSALVALLLVAVGFSAAQIRTRIVAGPVLAEETRPVTVAGEITHVEYQDKRIRLTLADVAIISMEPEITPGRVRVSMSASMAGEDETVLVPGRTVSLRAILRPPPGPALPGGYNFARHLFYEQIGAVGFSIGKLQAVGEYQGSGFWSHVEAARQRIALAARATLPDESGAVATALLTGQRGGISDETYDTIRRAGIAHLLAISGLHLGVMSGWLFLMCRLLLAAMPGFALRHPIKKYSAAIALLGTAIYVLLAGAPVPTIRAFIMVSLGIGAIWLDRDPFSLRLVGVAAILLILFRPEAVTGPSFQMSFAAVTALIVTYQFFKAKGWVWLQNPGQGAMPKLARFVLGLCITTIVASLATAPFAIYHFQQVATFGLVGNLIGVPLASLWIIPTGMVSLLLMPMGLEHWPLLAMGYGIDLLLQVSADIAAMPYASLATLAVKPAVVGAVVLLTLLALARMLPVGLLCLALAGITLTVTPWQPVPRLLASEDGDLIGITDMAQHGLYLSQTRRNSFMAGQWGQHLADAEITDWNTAEQTSDLIRCDGDGCIVREGNEPVIGIARTHGLIFEDCGMAAVILLPHTGSHRCKASQMITRNDLRGSQGLALYDKDGTLVVRTVRDLIGNRPWASGQQTR